MPAVTRRTCLLAAGAVAAFATAGCGGLGSVSRPLSGAVNKRSRRTVVELSAALRSGSISCRELMEEHYRVIEAGNRFNAFISLVDKDEALEQAARKDEQIARGQWSGPLHGIPVALKDNIHLAGVRNSAGTPALRDFIPERDAPVVARLREAGAVFVGKNNMHELAYGITGVNGAFGAVRNAVDIDYMAGGSSSGTAVAVATGMVPLGLGTDTGGSVRIPSALNGVVGFRPGEGRYPRAGITPISNTRDTAGAIANCVADVALADQLLSGEPLQPFEAAELQGLRLAVPHNPFYLELHQALQGIVSEQLKALRSAGVKLLEQDMPELMSANEKVGFPIVLYETSQVLPAYLSEYQTGISAEQLLEQVASADVKGILQQSLDGAISQAVYAEALNTHRPALQALYGEYFKQTGADAIIVPTTPLPASPLSENMDTVPFENSSLPTFPTYIRNTDPASNAALPAVSIPAGVTAEGLPVGIELVGRSGTDRHLLSIAAAVENIFNT